MPAQWSILTSRAYPGNGYSSLKDKKMLSRHLATLQGPIYYIAGPPAMVVAMRQMLLSAGVEEDDIRAEEFTSY